MLLDRRGTQYVADATARYQAAEHGCDRRVLGGDLGGGVGTRFPQAHDARSNSASTATIPNRARVEQIRPGMQRAAFVFWDTPGSALPIAWDEARRRLQASRPH